MSDKEYPLAAEDAYGEIVCPECKGRLGHSTPDGSLYLRQCGNCKLVFRIPAYRDPNNRIHLPAMAHRLIGMAAVEMVEALAKRRDSSADILGKVDRVQTILDEMYEIIGEKETS